MAGMRKQAKDGHTLQRPTIAAWPITHDRRTREVAALLTVLKRCAASSWDRPVLRPRKSHLDVSSKEVDSAEEHIFHARNGMSRHALPLGHLDMVSLARALLYRNRRSEACEGLMCQAFSCESAIRSP